MLTARAKAKARAKRALQVRQSNTRRDARFTAVRMLNTLAGEILGSDFPGETSEGAGLLAAAVRKALNIRFQNTQAPNTLFVDRGPGFWATNSGKITGGFKAALEENNLKAYYRDDAGQQPGNLQEVLLHETAVSWIRRREALNRMAKPWEETPEQFATRLKAVVQEINDTLNVEGLCRAFKQRVQKLLDRDGDRISH